MRKNCMLLSLPLAFMIGCAARAENIVEYEDDVVCFSYDSDAIADIYCLAAEDDYVYYSINFYSSIDDGTFSCGTVYIEVYDYPECLETFGFLFDESSNAYGISVIDDSEFPEAYIESRVVADDGSETVSGLYCNELYHDDNYAIYVNYFLPDDPSVVELCQAIYDSIEVSEYFVENSYTPVEEYEYKQIFVNLEFSEQALNYAKEAIRISESYLDFSMSSSDAVEQIEAVLDRFAGYCENTDNSFDSKIESKISSLYLDILLNKDYDVVEDISVLKKMCKFE